jgi:hypothetical protein
MYKFVLAREQKGKQGLPGRPYAIVRSTNPNLNKLFLCTVLAHADGGPEAALHVDEGGVPVSHTKKHSLPRPNKDTDERTIEKALAPAPGALLAAQKAVASAHATVHAGTKRSREPSISGGAGTKQARSSTVREADGDEEDDSEEEKETPKAFASKKADVIALPAGAHFEPLPETDPEWRYTAYPAGSNGSGKSKWSAGMLRRFHKLYPDRPLFLVCKTKAEKDPAFDGLPIHEVPMDFLMDGGADDIEKAFGTDCLVFFDDWDSMEPGQLKKVQAIIEDILMLGRKLNIACIVTSHLLTNYNQTRAIIHECDNIVLFPQKATYDSMRYMLKKLGVPKNIGDRVKSFGRWVLFHLCEPNFLLSERRAEMFT